MTGPETAEEFAGRMVEAIDGASLTILLSIGHQTGLLDTMAGLLPRSAGTTRADRGRVARWCVGAP